MKQLVYNTLPLSYLQGILGVKGFMLVSIKHKGVTFNCKGERRWDKTNYLYSLAAIFYLTSALGPLLCWPVEWTVDMRRFTPRGAAEQVFVAAMIPHQLLKMTTVIYRCDVFILHSFCYRGPNTEGSTLIPHTHICHLSHFLFLYAGCKTSGLVYG